MLNAVFTLHLGWRYGSRTIATFLLHDSGTVSSLISRVFFRSLIFHQLFRCLQYVVCLCCGLPNVLSVSSIRLRLTAVLPSSSHHDVCLVHFARAFSIPYSLYSVLPHTRFPPVRTYPSPPPHGALVLPFFDMKCMSSILLLSFVFQFLSSFFATFPRPKRGTLLPHSHLRLHCLCLRRHLLLARLLRYVFACSPSDGLALILNISSFLFECACDSTQHVFTPHCHPDAPP